MHAITQRVSSGAALLLSLAAALTPTLHAQAESGPAKVIVIQREYLKPGKGMAHEKTEKAVAHAFAEAKIGYPYIALDSLTGADRALFVTNYESFADWEKAGKSFRDDKGLAAKVGEAMQADGDLLASVDQAAFALRPDLSLTKGPDMGTRYVDMTLFVVKSGHMHDFTELAHLYQEAWRKAGTDTHWNCYELVYGNAAPGGGGGDVFLVETPMKSMAEIDQSLKDSDKFEAQLGAEGMKKSNELASASIEASSSNVFAVNPAESNPSASLLKEDPDFWKVK